MKPLRPAAAAVFSLLFAFATAHAADLNWARTWAASPQAPLTGLGPLSPSLQIGDATLRQVVRISGGGQKVRIRFTNEFARHKALDLIGDLILSGKRILGHVIAVKPGHGPNTKMASTLRGEYSRMRSMIPPFSIPKGETVLDIHDVLKILPHRYPFLLVDRVVDFEGDAKCTGIKNVTMNEPFFPGHFPDHPIMPGVLQLEAMAQVSSVLMLRKPENAGKIGYFMSADDVKWRRPVLPGDTLFIEAEVIKIRGSIGQTRCKCLVNGEVVSEGELKFALMDR